MRRAEPVTLNMRELDRLKMIQRIRLVRPCRRVNRQMPKRQLHIDRSSKLISGRELA